MSRIPPSEGSKIRRERLLAEFAEAWNRGQAPQIEEQLANYEGGRDEVLFELVLLECRKRLEASQPVRLEEYLKRLPELSMYPDRVAELQRAIDSYMTTIRPIHGMLDSADLRAYERTQRHAADESRVASASPGASGREARNAHAAGTLMPPGENGKNAPPEPRPDPLHVVGDVLDSRYRVTQYIGGGGMGHVYAARDLRFDRADDAAGQVAVKFMRHASTRQDGFRREAHLMRQFRHQNFVEVYDYGVTDSGLAWLVMEYLPGTTLENILERHQGRLPLELLVKFVREVCTALHSAHSRNLVHRDLKPANIMLVHEEGSAEACFKILDFGLSTRIDSEDSLMNHTMDSAGTPTYMSPEQIKGDPVTPHSDIYSLGVILFQLLTGHFPILGTKNQQIMFNHISTPPRQFRDVVKDLPFPAGVELVVMQCLEKSADGRPKDVAEVQARLLAELEPKPAPPARSRWTNGVWIFGAGLAAVCLAIWLRPVPQPAPQPSGRNGGPQGFDLPPASGVKVSFRDEEIQMAMGGEQTVPFEWSGVPEGAELSLECMPSESVSIQVSPATLDGQSGQGELRLKVPQSEKSRSQEIKIVASIARQGGIAGDSARQTHSLQVRVVWLPPGFSASTDAEVTPQNGNYYFTRIERRFGDAEIVKFVLVPKVPGNKEPGFYIMQNKVWRGLFAMFLKTASVQRISQERKSEILEFFNKEANSSRKPATDITVSEAWLCTQWLAGDLFPLVKANFPTNAQWNRASGFDFHYNKCGPSKTWDSTRWVEGPYHHGKKKPIHVLYDVGSAAEQVSCYDCFDMAANGSEFLNAVTWVSHTSEPIVPDPPPNLGEGYESFISVRGSVAATFMHMDQSNLEPYEPDDFREKQTGFRVAISLE